MKTRAKPANSADTCGNENMADPANVCQKPTRDAGSTIVGVLAALVFIGIVVAGMLKNTGSQATVSGSYGKVSAAQLSVRNGFVATEGFFLNTANGANRTRALDSAIKYPNNNNHQIFVYPLNITGTATHSAKTDVGSNGRKISCRIKSFNYTSKIMELEVKSEKNFRTGRAFYHVGVDIQYPPPGTNPFNNTLKMNGSMADGNGGVDVDGPVTIKGNVKLQNRNNKFADDVYIGGNLDIPSGSKSVFEKAVRVQGTTTIQDAATFNDDAWFDNTVTVANKAIEFKKGFVAEKDVDINNYSQSGKLFGGNTIINGDFLQVSQNNDLTIGGDFYIGGNIPQGANRVALFSGKKFYYSDALTNLPSTTNVPIANQNLIAADATPAPASKTNPNGNVGNVNRCDMTKVLPKEDPQININKIQPQTLIHNANSEVADGGNIFSIAKLDTLWKSVKDDESKLYNGHLVVKMTSDMTIPSSGTFNGKVIFIVEDGNLTCGGSGGTFFSNNGASSSTMVYVGPSTGGKSPKVTNFGTSGTFNGLIYIDEANTATDNSFMWNDGSKINGAVHNLSSQKLIWNTGTADRATPIHFDETILGQYGPLIDCNKAPVCQSGQTATGGPNATCKSQSTAPSCIPCPTSGTSGTPSVSTGQNSGAISLWPIGFYNY